MALNSSLLFLIAAVVCIVIALLLVLGVVHGSNEVAWFYGGMLAFVLAHFPSWRPA